MQIKSYCLAICLLIGGAIQAAAQNISTNQYIETYKNIAMEEMRRSGVPAAIKLAQGILETQSGNGWLVLNSNNHFGIKCKNNWSGKSVNYDDDARQECFRKYDSPQESWKDHSNFLLNNPRYKFLFELNPEDYKAWAYGLKTAGYATSRTYPQQLIQIIENYNLQQYNAIAMGKTPIPSGPVFVKDNEAYAPVAETSGSTAGVVTPAAPAKQYPLNTEFKINNRKVIFVKEGTALIQVASQRDIRLSTLLKNNDLAEDRPLEKDMLIFLQGKLKKGVNDYHIVAPGESLHDIAQAEGVQIKWLRKRNKLEEGDEPAAGERIALDGYASAKPRLGRNAVAKVDEHKDLEPKKIIRDIKEEIAKARETAETTPQAQPARTTAKPSGIPPEMVEDLKRSGGTVTPAGSQVHTVGEKETLYSISRRYNITVAQLQQWNNLQDNGIKIGQQLVVRK